MEIRRRLERELVRLSSRRRPLWRLGVRAAMLQVGGYIFLARWWLIPLLPFTIGFWAAIRDPTVPDTLPALLTVLTILLVFSIGRTHFRRLPFGQAPSTDGWVDVDPQSPLALLVSEVASRMGRPLPARLITHPGLGATAIGTGGRWRVSERTLALGSGLAEVLDAEQLQAVIAHELAHNGEQFLVNTQVHRTSAEWAQLTDDIAETAIAAPLLGPFLRWWAPKVVATAIALSQARELAADRHSAAATNANASAQALLRHSLAGWMLANSVSFDGESTLATHFDRWLASHEAGAALEELLQPDAATVDSHPDLATRLRALGAAEPFAVETAGEPAVSTLADPLLIDAQARMTIVLAEINRLHFAPPEELEAPEVAWRAMQVAAAEPELAIALLEQAAETEAPEPWWLFELGRTLLERGDRAGLDWLERAMQIDPLGTYVCCAVAAELLGETEPAVAAAYAARGTEGKAVLDAFLRERESFGLENDVMEHDLGDAELDELAGTVEVVGGCAEAMVSMKVLEVHPELDPCYVLLVRPQPVRWWQLEHDDAEVRLQERLAATIDLKHRMFIVGRKPNDPIWDRISEGPWRPVPTAANDVARSGSSTRAPLPG